MNQKFYDPLRQSFYVKRPEERVRQRLLCLMIEKLGYPKSLISVEKDLRLLPHLKEKKRFPPKRRVDILCFGQDIHPNYPLYPLLLIECKAEVLSKNVIEQVMGYNHFVRAFFTCIANETSLKLFYFTGGPFFLGKELDFLPPFSELVECAKRCPMQTLL